MNTLRLLLLLSVILGAVIAVQSKRSISSRTDVSIKNNEDKTTENTPSPLQSTSQLQDYIYPSARQVSVSENVLTLESADDPDKITDWYRQKIGASTMNLRTFVKTKTNDTVMNILVGAKDNRTVRIEIARKSEQAIVSIKITTLSS